jgi:enterochelin esterase-like enzyme
MKNCIHILSVLVFSLIVCVESSAQRRPPITSPEINADGSVTFRYSSTKAQKVELSAEFLKENQPLTKVDSALWSLTVNSIEPDIYPYFFIVDGVSLADPNNAVIFPNERFKRSLVDVPGKMPLLHDLRDVPHGTLTSTCYKSKSLTLTRPLTVYLPPGYEKNTNTKYPVLYLIHGMTDTEETWVKVGRINLILDNLIAQGKTKPMIVVMPYANPYPALLLKDRSTNVDLLNTDIFVKEMLGEVIPFTESNYRVLTSSINRAIAGFSLGGRQTLAAGLSNPKTFGWVCAFAPAVWKREFDETFTKLYASPADVNANLKLLSISCGKSDFLYQSATDFVSVLDEKKIKYQVNYSEGGHTWMNVRNYVAQTSQLLFK